MGVQSDLGRFLVSCGAGHFEFCFCESRKSWENVKINHEYLDFQTSVVNLTIFNGCIMLYIIFFQFSDIIFFSFKCITHNKTKILGIKNTVRVPSRVKLIKNPFSSVFQQIYGDFVICFEMYVYCLASEDDKWVFLISKNHGHAVPLIKVPRT